LLLFLGTVDNKLEECPAFLAEEQEIFHSNLKKKKPKQKTPPENPERSSAPKLVTTRRRRDILLDCPCQCERNIILFSYSVS